MTSLNWKITASVGDGRVYIEEAGNPGFPIITTDTPERARFVLEACSNYAGLVEALQMALDDSEVMAPDGRPLCVSPETLQRMRAALALSRGGPQL